MFVPIILGSDKTTVSVGTGHNQYWPVYLSIGNIHNNARRAHQNGVVVLGFLATAAGKYLTLILSITSTKILLTNAQLIASLTTIDIFAISAANSFTQRLQRCLRPFDLE